MTDAPTISLVDAMTAADALVDYALRHLEDRNVLGRVASALRALDYPESAASVERIAATVREHSVRVDA